MSNIPDSALVVGLIIPILVICIISAMIGVAIGAWLW